MAADRTLRFFDSLIFGGRREINNLSDSLMLAPDNNLPRPETLR
jgi:hypothetical protein